MGMPDTSPDRYAWQNRPGFEADTPQNRRESATQLALGKTDPEKPRSGDLFDINPDVFGSLEVRPEDIFGLR